MPLLLILASAVLVGYAVVTLRRVGTAPRLPETARYDHDVADAEARRISQEILSAARTDALRLREAALDEITARADAQESLEALLQERDREWRERRQAFDERRHAHKRRAEELQAQRDHMLSLAGQNVVRLEEVAHLTSAEAKAAVLARLETELAAEHGENVERAVAARIGGDAAASARTIVTEAIERQDRSHADGAPRPAPIPVDDIPDPDREEIFEILGMVAEGTSTELVVDVEKGQASLRGLDPVGREVARQAGLEIMQRKLEVAEVPPLLIRTRTALHRRIVDLGERALWTMQMDGRPELAELVGTLHFRFSYGQNALLHCQETGYVCGVLAAELGMDQAVARRAGMLHDIGKAVDHDVEGSHAIIGGELLCLFGTPEGIVHAVKAHHFDEEPTTQLALLTICADAVSASRPGARRDTLATYLARLDQLQEIATRHSGVERAFPLQAGREVRVVVKPRQVRDDQVPVLSAAIARDIEAEMQYPGVIKVTVIREQTATATAPAQLVLAGRSDSAPTRSSAETDATPRRRRRRRRKSGARSGGSPDAPTATPTPSE